MTTVQVADRTRDELAQIKRETEAPSIDAVIWELLHPRPRKRAVVDAIHVLAGPLRGLGVKRMHLFGSVVRDEARPGSDVDLIVELGPKGTYYDLAKVQSLLEAATGHRCDVVPPGGLHPALADAIRAEAEVVLDA
jgi:uncharacterized protein